MVDASKMKDASPWHPMSDPVDIKHVGKLIEELGEAVSALARALIQGIDEVEPETLKPNRAWIQDEFADILAGMALAEDRFNLIIDQDRIDRKVAHLTQWHNLA